MARSSASSFRMPRDKDQTLTYIAERGQIVESASGTFLILEKGSVQRQLGGDSSDASIVVFERYAFDLSQLVDEPDVTTFKPRERYTGELFDPDPTDKIYLAAPGRFRAELVDRLVAPLYPVAFMLIALAALGQARTTRQSRGVARSPSPSLHHRRSGRRLRGPDFGRAHDRSASRSPSPFP